MKILEYGLTRILTRRITERAVEEGKRENENNRVEQVPGFLKFFRFIAVLSVVLGLAVAFLAQQPMPGLFLFLIFGAVSFPILISYHTCWIEFDDEGFTQSTFFGRTHRYSYLEVTGLYSDHSCVLVEVKDRRKIELNETWINRNRFAQCICAHTKNLKKLAQPLVGMSMDQIEESYQKGILNKALLVPKKEWMQFKVHRNLHRVIVSMSLVCLVFMVFAQGSRDSFMHALFFLNVALLNVLVLVALVLYYAYPSFYTMREKASGLDLDKELLKRHKCCTMPVAAVCSAFANALFFVLSASDPMRTITGVQIILAALIVTVLVWTAVHRFKRKSLEYRQYRVGLVSFVFWQCWYGMGLLLFLIAMGI